VQTVKVLGRKHRAIIQTDLKYRNFICKNSISLRSNNQRQYQWVDLCARRNGEVRKIVESL
jgi:hypothetical protein